MNINFNIISLLYFLLIKYFINQFIFINKIIKQWYFISLINSIYNNLNKLIQFFFINQNIIFHLNIKTILN